MPDSTRSQSTGSEEQPPSEAGQSTRQRDISGAEERPTEAHESPERDERDRGATEPDPNPEQRTGGRSHKLGKSLQQEDYK